MKTKIIGLIAAIPEEIRPLLKRAGNYKKEKVGRFDAYRFSMGNEKLLLVKSGMGLENAAAATEALINDAKPGLIINFGFCGGITPEHKIGDVAVAHRILINNEALFSPQSGIDEEGAKLLSRSLADSLTDKDFKVFGGVFITVAEIRRKDELAPLIPSWAKNPVLEMETAAVVKEAIRKGVRIFAVRSVSDDGGEELSFSLNDLTDENREVKTGKVLMTVAKRPWVIPQMLRLSKGSKKAGENLATAITSLLEEAGDLQVERERPY
jgi:adenosylhomocysteine nucleosidase